MKNLFVCLFLLAFVTACRKNDGTNSPTAQIVASNFNPMKVGNYWIYQIFKEDNAGVLQATSTFDSTYIASDTLVRGRKFFKFVSRYGSSVEAAEPNHDEFLSDSAGYLISGFKGRRIFSTTDFTNDIDKSVLTGANAMDTIYVNTIKMLNNTTAVVPAGSFSTITADRIQDIHPNYRGSGSRFRHHNTRFYADNIGVVKEELCNYLFQPLPKEEKRLVRFKVN
jgi:hypothetical protein